MSQAIDIGRPEPEQTRTELTLSRIGRAWSMQIDGRRYTEALIDYLRSRSNQHTLRSYSYSILEFFGWYEQRYSRLTTPDQVRRIDAIDFERWLRDRRHGLTEAELAADPERRLDLAIYRLVLARPGIGVAELRSELLRQPGFGRQELVPVEGGGYEPRLVLDVDRLPGGLGKRLGCLVEVKTLRRAPSIEQIRRGQVDIGLPLGEAARVGIDIAVPEEVFRYQVAQDERGAAERASTIATRLAALSGFWSYLTQTGENVGSATPLIRVNIWTELLEKARRQAPSHQQATRAAKTPGLPVFERLLATTYARRFGPLALQMAAAQMRPSEVARPEGKQVRERYADVRDRALMLLMGQTGVRAEELGALRRQSVSGDPPMLTVVGKGGTKRQLRLPPASMEALGQLSHKLADMARHQARYYPERAARAADLLRPAAPLLPAVSHWGKNAAVDDSDGLTRQGIAMMLRRRAVAAGIDPDSPEFARIHPHGLRHLFAKTAIGSGTPVNVVQAIMGHRSGAQTLRYMEERAPEALIARGFAEAPAPPAPAPAAPPPPRVMPPRAAPMPPRAAPPEPILPRAAVPLRPIAVLEEAEPERVPPPERLVGLGRAPEPIVEIEKEESEMRLAKIYDERWGEPGDRIRVGRTEVPVAAELEELGVGIEIAEILGTTEIVEAAGVGAERLVHCYKGKSSGLVWWAGPTGKLKPEMPVMSPRQAGDCTAERQAAVCAGLVALWRRWMGGEGRGPTGAAALVGWVAEALGVTQQLGAELAARGGHWVESDAPWDETSDDPAVMREHDPEAVVAWFEEVAWQFRRARTRDQKVIDAPLVAPAFYASPDPIAELPDEERDELLDWLAAMTGELPRDQRPRFGGLGRADLGKLVQAMCSYDQQRDLVAELGAELKRGEGSAADIRMAEIAAQRQAEQTDRLAHSLGAPWDFRIEDRVKDRIAKRKGGERVQRREFYLGVLGELFGREAGADPVMALVAMCGKTPLAEERMKRLFAIDWLRRTIQHDPRYARHFALDTGAHSECVARRIARELWELSKASAGKRARLLERPDELVSFVEAMRAYRVPCPEALERELGLRLGKREPVPIYEAWAAEKRAAEIGRMPATRSAIEEELRAFGEEYGEEIAADLARDIFAENPRARPNRYTKKAVARLPTPVELIAAVATR